MLHVSIKNNSGDTPRPWGSLPGVEVGRSKQI